MKGKGDSDKGEIVVIEERGDKRGREREGERGREEGEGEGEREGYRSIHDAWRREPTRSHQSQNHPPKKCT